MDFAQSEIAGEAPSRLHDTKSLTDLPGDAPVPTGAYACDETNLPYQVLRAHRRALSVVELKSRARNALAAIALTVSKDQPLNSVFARRPYLAKRAGLSDRTWYRAEEDLVKAGLIRVEEQGRKKGGLFGAAYIYLSESAARLLGFLQPAPAAPSVPAPELSSAAQPTATVADRPIYRFYQSPLSQKRQPGDLPEDVKPLLALGFQKNYIFALMKRARVQHGKRLGDVVAVAGDLLRKATYPRSYLRALLHSPTDFGFLARQQLDARRNADRARADQQKLASLQERLAGRVFYDRDAAQRFEVSSDAAMLTVHNVDEAAARVNAHGWISGFARMLASHTVVPATPELDAAFADHVGQRAAARPCVLTKAPALVPRQRTAASDQHLASLSALLGFRRATAQVAG